MLSPEPFGFEPFSDARTYAPELTMGIQSPEPFGFEPFSDGVSPLRGAVTKAEGRQSLSASSPFRTYRLWCSQALRWKVARAFRLRALFGPLEKTVMTARTAPGRQSLSASSPFRTLENSGKYKQDKQSPEPFGFEPFSDSAGVLCESECRNVARAFRLRALFGRTLRAFAPLDQEDSRQSLSASSPFRTSPALTPF